jgi:hypothetical protein
MTVTMPTGTFQLARTSDSATAVQLARRVVQSGAWRLAPKTGGDAEKATYAIRLHAPAALTVLSPLAIHAATKRPPPGGCQWCCAYALSLLSFGKDVEPPRDDLTLAFLGRPCRRCQARHASDAAVAAAVRESMTLQARIDQQVQAAGGPLAYYRAKQQRDQAVAPYARRIDRLAARLGCDRDLVADAFAAALAAPPRFTDRDDVAIWGSTRSGTLRRCEP